MRDRFARTTNRAQTLAIDALTARVESAEQRLVLVEGQADDLEGTTRSADASLVALRSDLSQLQGLVDPLFGAVRDLAARVEALEQPTPPVDPPPPVEQRWTLLRNLATVKDWDDVLNEAPGSTITDEDGYIRIYQPQRGERCELQCYDKRLTGGVTARYTWEVWISPDTQLDPSGSGTDTISQQHGNQSGYGGGLTIRASDRMVILRVKGGERTSTAGSQRYEYESDGKGGSPAEPPSNVEVGVLPLGEWHRITVTARWSKMWTGYVTAQLDDRAPVGVRDVPTLCEPADVQMFRLGFYSSEGPVPKDMRIRNAKVEVR